MNIWKPYGPIGWLGLGLLAFAVWKRKTLTLLGMVLFLGLAAWLYLIVDQPAETVAST